MDKISNQDKRGEISLSEKASRDHITHHRSSSWEGPSSYHGKELARDQFTERADKPQRFPVTLATERIDRDWLHSALKSHPMRWERMEKGPRE